MQKKFSKNIFFITVLSIITLISFLTFKNSLHVALSGDDWLAHYTIWMIFDVRQDQSWFELSTYFCTYCPHYLFLSIIKYFWGIDPFYHYLISLIIRVGISFSLFFLLYKLTKSLLAATVSSLIFSVSVIGIQSTDWVFNFTHYMGVITVILFIYIYYKAKESDGIIWYAAIPLLFALSLIVSPPRMHGLLPLALVAEIGWLLIELKKYNFKTVLLRIGLLLLIYKVVFSGSGYGTTEYNIQQVIKGLSLAKEMLSQGNYMFLFNIVTSLGNYIIPDKSMQTLAIHRIHQAFILSLVYTILTALVIKVITKIKWKLIIVYAFTSSILSLIVSYLGSRNTAFYPQHSTAFALIGLITIIFTLWLFFLYKKTNPKLSHLLFLTLGWITTFSLFPWLIAPYSILDTTLRYSLHQGVGMTIWIGVISYLLISKFQTDRKPIWQGIIIGVLCIYGFMHFLLTQNYINLLVETRGIALDQRLWNTIFTDIPSLPNDSPTVFLLIYDDPYIAEWDLRFGFSSRAAIHYNITNQKANPFMIYEYDTLLSMIADGKALVAQGYAPNPIPLDHVYGYQLTNKQLINITNELRMRLSRDVQALQTKDPLTLQQTP